MTISFFGTVETRLFGLFLFLFRTYRYVDDTFTMFESKDTANEFLRYLNSRHESIKFTIDFEQDNEIPFLDVLIKRCPNNTCATSIYRKKTFTGLYTKWDSFTPLKYKINLIRTLTYRCYRICSSAFLLKSALDDLRKLLLQNGYPHGIIAYVYHRCLCFIHCCLCKCLTELYFF